MVETRFGKFFLFLILVTVVLSSCDQVPIPESQKYTLKGTSTKTPFQIQYTYTPTKEPPPTFTPTDTASPSPTVTETPTETETAQVTDTATPEPATETTTTLPDSPTPKKDQPANSDKPTIKVSITTNCRTGPGTAYSKLTPLQAGKAASLIGRDKNYSYWIIKDPGKTGRDCWVWGYYASTTGDVKSLKVYSAPDVDPPAASKTPYPTQAKTTPAATKTPKPTRTPAPTLTPKTPLPTNTPNLTPATWTNTPLPPTETPIPSETPLPSDTPPPSNTPLPSNTPESMYCSYTSAVPAEEQQIFDMINEVRRKRGLNELTVKRSLVTAARLHGQDMTCHGTYSHTSTDGTKAWERIGLAVANRKDWCYSHCCCGEIFMGGGSPESAFNWWMTHEPVYQDGLNIHAWTILGKYYTRMGVGVIRYYNPNTGVTRKFYVVDFVRY